MISNQIIAEAESFESEIPDRGSKRPLCKLAKRTLFDVHIVLNSAFVVTNCDYISTGIIN
jgi:hypothetical protein